jgi:agmatinase
LEAARVALLPVPYDATTSFFGGARHAPEAILRASHHIEEYDEELGREPWTCGIHTAAPVEPHPDPDFDSDSGSGSDSDSDSDSGSGSDSDSDSDFDSDPGPDPQHMVRRIQRRCAALVEAGKWVITLGGDHTVAVGAGRAHAAAHGPLSVLQIDAHADLRASYEGSPYSHACAARRLWESEGVERVVGVGIRALSRQEAQWLREGDHPVFYAQEIARRAAQAPNGDDAWIDEVVEALGPRVYVTFDVDGLDPAVLPATGTPEPGGLCWWTALRLLRRVAEARQVVGADVCELLPTPGLHASDVTTARLVYKMIGYFL